MAAQTLAIVCTPCWHVVDWKAYGLTPPVADYTAPRFALALEVTELISTRYISWLLDAFEINARTSEIQELVRQRRSADMWCLDQFGAVPDRKYRTLECAVPVYREIKADECGRLTAALTGKGGSGSLRPVPTRPEPVSANDAERYTQNLYMESRLIGHTSAETRPGDVLVQFNNQREELYMVLRHHQGTDFHIVGQAVLEDHYHICGLYYAPCECVSQGQEAHQILMADFEWSLTPEDMITLWAQDIVEIRNTIIYFDPQAKMVRPATRVSVAGLCAARVTNMRSVDKQETIWPEGVNAWYVLKKELFGEGDDSVP